MFYLSWLAQRLTLKYLDIWGLHVSPGLGSCLVWGRPGWELTEPGVSPPAWKQDVWVLRGPPQSHWGWTQCRREPTSKGKPLPAGRTDQVCSGLS